METTLSTNALGSSRMKATHRTHRGFPRKVQEMVRKAEKEGERQGEREADRKEKFDPKNWRQLSEKQLSKLGPVARSRYQAYEPAAKSDREKQQEAMKRIREKRAAQKSQQGVSLSELIELERNSELVGQLRAAEARHRVRDLRERYEREKSQDLLHLIAQQPTSIEAVRLHSFLLPKTPTTAPPDTLNKSQRKRCEVLLEDDQGLTVTRTQ